jgi:hypothetical protein
VESREEGRRKKAELKAPDATADGAKLAVG